MALIMIGATTCLLCQNILQEGEDYMGFPHFVLNDKDRIFPFSDAVVHRICLMNDANGPTVLRELVNHTERSGPGKRSCEVCQEEVLDYREYVTTGLLISDQSHPLYAFNHRHFHQHHLAQWQPRLLFLQCLKESQKQDQIAGPAIQHLLEVMGSDS